MSKKNFIDEDYYDDDKPEKVENQPYDETVDIPDAEEVESVYTPTPRNPKNSAVTNNNNNNKLYSNTLKPPGSEEPRRNMNEKNRNMSDNSLSSQETQKQSAKPVEPLTGNSLNKNSLAKTEKKIKRDDEPNYPVPTRPLGTGADLPVGQINARNLAISREVPLQKMSADRGSASGSAGGANQAKGNRENDTGESESEGNDSAEDSQQEQLNELQGGYDPAAFRDLPVSPEIKEIFKFIERYQPQTIELEFKLKPFIPEYIPCIGDIDAFLKIPRPDGKQENLGYNVLDEPSSRQSDPHVLDLQLRALSKQSSTSNKPTLVKSVEHANPKAIDSWIKNISDLQKNKPVQIVNYQKTMPDIEALMQQWPPEYEDLLKEVNLPSADLNVELPVYVNILCGLLDIPVYKSKIQSLHVLFSLYSEFKNSGHFNQNMDENQTEQNPFAPTNKKKANADQLIIE